MPIEGGDYRESGQMPQDAVNCRPDLLRPGLAKPHKIPIPRVHAKLELLVLPEHVLAHYLGQSTQLECPLADCRHIFHNFWAKFEQFHYF
jgi:hypothetical protein